MQVTPGTRLGPYEIVAPVGAGGMGEVWRARDTRLDRTVAIKVLPAALAADANLHARFEREARAISALNHPHICTLHDVGREDGLHYLVMELIEGESLAERLKRGPLPLDQTLRYGAQIATALDAAHRRGIVHRDLKPANVMLTKSGAKLLDFGLATDFLTPGQPAVSILQTAKRDITQEGTILGTFQYMAPEQLEGLQADSRTDIFAFGAVLYEMATGKRAFQGNSRTSLIAAIVSSQPEPISAIAPLTPPAFDHLVRKCLEKDPDERWQSAHDVATEMQWISEAGSAAGVPAAARLRRATRLNAVVLLAGLALGVAVTAAYQLARTTRTLQNVNHLAVVPPAGATINADRGVALAPDGRSIVFAAGPEGQPPALWLRRMSARDATPLPGTENGSFPFWSPDGRSIGFFAQSKLKRIDVAGGPPDVICAAPQPRGGAWGRHGRIVFAAGALEGLSEVSASGGQPRELTKLALAKGEKSHRWPLFVPGSESVLFLAQTSDRGVANDTSAIMALDRGGAMRRLVDANSSFAFISPGHLLYWKNGSLVARAFRPKSLEISGEAERVIDRVVYTNNEQAIFSTAADGTLAYISDAGKPQQVELAWVGRDGSQRSSIKITADNPWMILSPDGARAAYTFENEIRVRDLRRGTDTRLSQYEGDDIYPMWSRDGQWVYWSSRYGVKTRISRRAASGAGQPETVLETTEWEYVSDVSPDGTWLLGVNERPPAPRVLKYDFAQRRISPVTGVALGAGDAKLSADGQWLAFTSDESGQPEVYIQRMNGEARLQISNAGGHSARWTPDGKEILYLTRDWAVMAVSLRWSGDSVDAGIPRQLIKGEASVKDLAVTRDGSIVLTRYLEQSSSEPIGIVQNWRPGS